MPTKIIFKPYKMRLLRITFSKYLKTKYVIENIHKTKYVIENVQTPIM